MQRGKLLVISGPSGVGKSTAIQGMLEKHPKMYFSVSATTRKQREGDVEGVTYFFKTAEAFADMVSRDEFFEHAEYAGNCYGTSRAPVEQRLAAGIDVIMDIDVQGAMQLREKCPDAVLIFLVAPSFSVIEKRLRGRGDTGEADMEKRLKKARWEYEMAVHYDYIVLNDTPEHAVNAIDSILTAEKLRAERQTDLLKMEELL